MAKPLRCALACLAAFAGASYGDEVVAAVRAYAVVADAGSTGTRAYLFSVEASAGGMPKIEITDLGKGPALSSFQASPEMAAGVVKPQLEQARRLIPESAHASVSVAVLATAGMRLVELSKAEAIYEGLRAGLLDDFYAFDRASFQARTISGREEGVFAFLAANYLSQRIHASLVARDSNLLGVMDLGGSSTQIAVPPIVEAGSSLTLRLGEEQMYVQSFLSLGMERMRQLTHRTLVEGANDAAREIAAVSNPCAFFGYVEAGDVWRGTGDASECQKVIAAILRKEMSACMATHPGTCLPMGNLPVPAAERRSNIAANDRSKASARPRQFLLISGFMFVTDFARWWFERPGSLPEQGGAEFGGHTELAALVRKGTFERPTLAELRAAAVALCAAPWQNVSFVAGENAVVRHRYTAPQKVPHRCFELNYIVVLLSMGYGFQENVRAFHIVDSIEGKDVEWSLGAFLSSQAPRPQQPNLRDSSIGGFDSEPVLLATVVLLVAAVGYMAWRVLPHCGESAGLHVN